MNSNTPRFTADVIAAVFGIIGDQAITEDSVTQAVTVFNSDEGWPLLDGALLGHLVTTMEAAAAGNEPPQTDLSAEEVAAVVAGWAMRDSGAVNPPANPSPTPPPPAPPAGPPVTVDEPLARCIAAAFEFVPLSLPGVQALGEGVRCVSELLRSEDGAAKSLEVLKVIQSERTGTAFTTSLAPEEDAAVRNAVRALENEAATSRFSKKFLLRLKQLYTSKSARKTTNDIRTTLHAEFTDNSSRVVLSTGSFNGIIDAAGALLSGKDPGEPFILQLRPCEFELVKEVFGKPTPPPAPVTREAVLAIVANRDLEAEPADFPQLKGLPKLKLKGVQAVIKAFGKGGAAAVKAPAAYQLDAEELALVLDVLRTASTRPSDPLTQAVLRAIYPFVVSDGEDNERSIGELTVGIDRAQVRAARSMIKEFSGTGLVKSHLHYGIPREVRDNILVWLRAIGAEIDGVVASQSVGEKSKIPEKLWEWAKWWLGAGIVLCIAKWLFG